MLHSSMLIAIALVLGPTICVTAWLVGYGPGGSREITSRYVITDIAITTVSLGVFAFILTRLPVDRRALVGYPLIFLALVAAGAWWFVKAAALAHV